MSTNNPKMDQASKRLKAEWKRLCTFLKSKWKQLCALLKSQYQILRTKYKLSNVEYFVHEGISNMFSHGLMSFASIGITVACLLIMGTFTLVAVNADAQLDELEEENEIVAYVDDACDADQTEDLQSQLEQIPGVSSVTFISKEEAMDAFKEDHPEEELIDSLNPQILEDRYAIHISDLSQLRNITEQVQELEGISDVNASEQVAGGFITIRNVATVISVALILVLFVVSVFIISNTIRLTTFARREEIAIMRMVGATNSFIRWPFVYEGLLIGLLSSAIAFFCQWGLYEAVAKGVSNSDTLQLIEVVPFHELWPVVALTFLIAGIVIGVGGSLSAIRKFLEI